MSVFGMVMSAPVAAAFEVRLHKIRLNPRHRNQNEDQTPDQRWADVARRRPNADPASCFVQRMSDNPWGPTSQRT